MCVCVYVYIYIYIYTHICMYIHTQYTHTHTYIYIYIHTYNRSLHHKKISYFLIFLKRQLRFSAYGPVHAVELQSELFSFGEDVFLPCQPADRT